MTKMVLWLAVAGMTMAGCAMSTPTAPTADQSTATQNTYRVMGGMQAQQAPVMQPPCIGCGDPAYFDRISASYDFRRPFAGGCGECGGDVWRFGIPGPTTLLPICTGGNCGAPPAPPVMTPEPAPTEAPHTKGDTPTTTPTEETSTVNY